MWIKFVPPHQVSFPQPVPPKEEEKEEEEELQEKQTT